MSDDEILKKIMDDAPDDEAAIRRIVRAFPQLSPAKQEDLVEEAYRDGTKQMRPIRDMLKTLSPEAQRYITGRYPRNMYDNFSRRIEDSQKRAQPDPVPLPEPKRYWWKRFTDPLVEKSIRRRFKD